MKIWSCRYSQRYIYIGFILLISFILLSIFQFIKQQLFTDEDNDIDRPSTCNHATIKKYIMHDKSPQELFEQKPVRAYFTYQLTNGNFCISSKPHVIIFVISKSRNFDSRNAIRRTWGNFDQIASIEKFSHLHFKLLFLIDIDETRLLSIRLEQRLYHDIVQVRLPQHYTLSTYRDMAALHWTETYCPEAMMTVKTDDDIFLNTYLLANILNTITKNQTFSQLKLKCNYSDSSAIIYGYELRKAQAIRYSNDITSEITRYIVTNNEYPCKYYPNYMSGFGYIINRNARSKLLCTFFRDKNPFDISDVYVTGILPEYINIRRKHIGLMVNYNSGGDCEDFFSRSYPDTYACASSLHYTTKQINIFERFNTYWKQIYKKRYSYIKRHFFTLTKT